MEAGETCQDAVGRGGLRSFPPAESARLHAKRLLVPAESAWLCAGVTFCRQKVTLGPLKIAAQATSFSAVQRLRLLQVGLGGHGRNWARRVIPDVPEVEVVGYVDSDPYALEIARNEIPPPPGMLFESLKEAISATRPEALLNTTALPGHVGTTRTALDAGMHVLLEKPFAPTLGAAHELVDVAAHADLVLMISQHYRYFPAPRAHADMVRGGRLGQLHEGSGGLR